MPELPEVETIRRDLLTQIRGRYFDFITLLHPQMVQQPSSEEFCIGVAGQRVEDIRRRGKYLIITLTSGKSLILHLKMNGVLLFSIPSSLSESYVRAIFNFQDGGVLYFCDRRKLGMMWLVKNENEVVGKLGPEPLEPEFTMDVLRGVLQRHNVPVKALLCDQSCIAGIGNIYSDEILFATRIHPLRRANALPPDEVVRLHQSIQYILTTAISKRGASIDTYRSPHGVAGTAHLSLQVAHRGNKTCYVCGSPIMRIEVRGRGTYFFPHCQGDTAQP
jgi:formamidopyrimidine-DNA glycosylase